MDFRKNLTSAANMIYISKDCGGRGGLERTSAGVSTKDFRNCLFLHTEFVRKSLAEVPPHTPPITHGGVGRLGSLQTPGAIPNLYNQSVHPMEAP